MSAMTFEQYQEGADIRVAFREAVGLAAYEHGHSGYTGSLAEKSEWVVTWHDPVPLDEAPVDFDDPRVADKWGPAGAIRIRDEEHDGWLFYGRASS